MTDPIALMLQFGFLAVLYLFLLWVARSALRDLSRHQDPSAAVEAPSANGRRPSARADLRAGVNPRLSVVAAMGYEPGTELLIGDGATIGRAPSSDGRIDDAYASSTHARIFPRGQFMYIEAMASTNGTYLSGRQLRQPEQLKVADRIQIGETEYTYQE